MWWRDTRKPRRVVKDSEGNGVESYRGQAAEIRESGEFFAANTRQLLIDGNAGDSVSASGQGWLQGSNVTVDGASYASYTVAGSAAQLLVDLEVTRTIS